MAKKKKLFIDPSGSIFSLSNQYIDQHNPSMNSIFDELLQSRFKMADVGLGSSGYNLGETYSDPRRTLAEAVAEDMWIKIEYQPQNGVSVRLKGAALQNGAAALYGHEKSTVSGSGKITEFLERQLGYGVLDIRDLLGCNSGFGIGVFRAEDFEGQLKDPEILEQFKKEIKDRNDLLVIRPRIDNIIFEKGLNCLESLVSVLMKDKMKGIRENAILSADGVDTNDSFIAQLHKIRYSNGQITGNRWHEVAELFAEYTTKIDTNAHVSPNRQFYQDNQYSFIGSDVTIGPLTQAIEILYEKLEGDKILKKRAEMGAKMFNEQDSILQELETTRRKAEEAKKAAAEKALAGMQSAVPNLGNDYYRVFNMIHLKDSDALKYFLKGLKANTHKDNRIAVLNFNGYEGDVGEACDVIRDVHADYASNGLWTMVVHRTEAGEFRRALRKKGVNTGAYADNGSRVYEFKDSALLGFHDTGHIGEIDQLRNVLGNVQVNGEVTIEDIEKANPRLIMPLMTEGFFTREDDIAQRDPIYSRGYDSKRRPLRMIEPNPDSTNPDSTTQDLIEF